jgi:hypothetical protein
VVLGCAGLLGPTGPLGFVCPPGAEHRVDAAGEGGDRVWPDTELQTCTNGDGARVGPHLERWTDGGVAAEGHWRDGRRNGEWTWWFADGAFAGRRTWADGVEDGPTWELAADGSVTEVVFEAGRAVGLRALPIGTPMPEWNGDRRVDGVGYVSHAATPL